MTETAALIWMAFHSYMMFCVMVIGWACVYGRIGAKRLDLQAWRPRTLLPGARPQRLQLGDLDCDGSLEDDV